MDILENYEQYLEAINELEVPKEDVLSEEDFVALGEEELQELSKDTLKKYTKKAVKSADKNWEKADKEEDKAMSTDGEKYPDKQKRHSDAANKHIDTWRKRTKGLETAAKKLKEEEEMDKNEEVVDAGQIDETAAADSLKPNSKPGDAMSRVEMMKGVMGAMSVMPKGDLTHWFKDAMAVFGPGKTYGVGDNSAKNAASIKGTLGGGPKAKDPMPKLSVKEDVEAMFAGQELSEEFKESASTLFEAAVSAKVIAEVARLEEEYEQKFLEETNTLAEEISTKLDTYLDYVVENWMEENAVAIESTLRNELMEDFMVGLKNLFTEHYINVPEDKVDVLEALAEKVSTLETKLDEAITENAELKGVLVEESAKDIFEEVASDLALTQKEKFAALAEGIEFDGDLDVYEKKLKIVKENYFKTEVTSTQINEETFEGVEEKTVAVDPSVNRYVQAISRSLKK